MTHMKKVKIFLAFLGNFTYICITIYKIIELSGIPDEL